MVEQLGGPLVRVLESCAVIGGRVAEGEGVLAVDEEGDAVADDALEAMPDANPPTSVAQRNEARKELSEMCGNTLRFVARVLSVPISRRILSDSSRFRNRCVSNMAKTCIRRKTLVVLSPCTTS